MSHRLAPQAEADLDDIFYYVARETGGFEIADRLVDSITRWFFLLARHPQLGRARDEELRPGLRSFAVGQYVILYRVERGDVLVLRVLQGRRNIAALLK